MTAWDLWHPCALTIVDEGALLNLIQLPYKIDGQSIWTRLHPSESIFYDAIFGI